MLVVQLLWDSVILWPSPVPTPMKYVIPDYHRSLMQCSIMQCDCFLKTTFLWTLIPMPTLVAQPTHTFHLMYQVGMWFMELFLPVFSLISFIFYQIISKCWREYEAFHIFSFIPCTWSELFFETNYQPKSINHMTCRTLLFYRKLFKFI